MDKNSLKMNRTRGIGGRERIPRTIICSSLLCFYQRLVSLPCASANVATAATMQRSIDSKRTKKTMTVRRAKRDGLLRVLNPCFWFPVTDGRLIDRPPIVVGAGYGEQLKGSSKLFSHAEPRRRAEALLQLAFSWPARQLVTDARPPKLEKLFHPLTFSQKHRPNDRVRRGQAVVCTSSFQHLLCSVQ